MSAEKELKVIAKEYCFNTSKLPAVNEQYRSTLYIVEEFLSPLLKTAVKHIIGRANVFNTLIEKNQFAVLLKNHTDQNGKQIAESNLLNQKMRAIEIIDQVSRVVCSCLVLQLSGQDSKQLWKKLNLILLKLQEPNFYSKDSDQRELYQRGMQELKDLKELCFKKTTALKEEAINTGKHALVTEALINSFHTIQNALTPIKVGYETISDILTNASTDNNLPIISRDDLSFIDKTRKIIKNWSVACKRKLSTREFKSLILSAYLLDSSNDDYSELSSASSLDFNLKDIRSLFSSLLSSCSKQQDQFILTVKTGKKAKDEFTFLSPYNRTLIGLVLEN